MLKRIIAIAVLPMALALSAGCSKDAAVATVNGTSVSYSVKVQDSKATLVNSEEAFRTTPGTFTCNAYDNGSSIYSGDITVKYSNSKWTPSVDATWERDHTLTFYAVANGTGTISSTGISCSHTVAATAEEQSDLMFGTYSGKGTEGKADITFSHPLTAVRFKMGDIATYVPGFTAITGISIEGVAAGGSIDWPKESDWTPTTFDKTVTLGVTTTPEEGSLIKDGEAFALIPQTLSDHPARISVSYSYTDGTSKTGAIVANISSGSWASGQSYTYTVNFKTLVLTIDDSGAVSEWATETGGTVEAEDAPEYVEIGGLKWCKQNLAISNSGRKSWKGGGSSAVKVPGTDENVIVGDYFQWAAHAGYCGNTGDADKGLLIYTAFNNTQCAGDTGSDGFTYKSAGGVNTYYFHCYTDDAVGIAPYFSNSKYTKYTSVSVNLDSSDDVATTILGGDWRIPTEDDFNAMKAATYWAWDGTDCGYYVFLPGQGTSGSAGGIGTIADTDDKTDALLFFPAAGDGFHSSLTLAGSYGYYWSSTLYTTMSNVHYAYNLLFYSGNVNPQDRDNRCYGFSVRPVSE